MVRKVVSTVPLLKFYDIFFYRKFTGKNFTKVIFTLNELYDWRVILIKNTPSRIKHFYKSALKTRFSSTILYSIISAFILLVVGFFPAVKLTAEVQQTLTFQPEMKGMTITAWSSEAYNSSNFDTSIRKLDDSKANWVTFTVFWFMESYTDTEMHPRTDLYTASNSSLIHAIQKAHELNMKVALKPMVDVLDGKWRGEINPYNWTLWFKNYQKFINFYADLAQNHSVELLIVGTELRSSQTHESEWRQVISNVRMLFSGNLTYAANWDSFSNYSILPNLAVKFWDVLDYVGVDAYFPLTNSFNPTVEELINAWSHSGSGWWGSGRNWTNQLYSTYVSTGKKVIFTEIGYCSQNGTNTQPWNYNVSPTKDLQEQADCYQAALEVFRNATWFEGWFWWNWETDPNAGKPGTPDEKHYTPQNKPAQEILKHYYYEVPPDIAILDVTPLETIIKKGSLVDINVTIENQGIYTENFSIALYANQTIILEENVTLENKTSTILKITWNTSATTEAAYVLEAFVFPLPAEVDTDDNLYTDGIVEIGSHDIAITDLDSPNKLNKTIVSQGYVARLNVTVENQGDFTENCNITIYANTIRAATQTLTVTNGNSVTLIFIWNTTGFVKGNYTIWAYAWPVPGETETGDNSLVDGWILVTMPGDVNGDGVVDIFDCVTIALAYSSTPNDPNWSPNADITNDNLIDIFDLVIVALHFGETNP